MYDWLTGILEYMKMIFIGGIQYILTFIDLIGLILFFFARVK